MTQPSQNGVWSSAKHGVHRRLEMGRRTGTGVSSPGPGPLQRLVGQGVSKSLELSWRTTRTLDRNPFVKIQSVELPHLAALAVVVWQRAGANVIVIVMSLSHGAETCGRNWWPGRA